MCHDILVDEKFGQRTVYHDRSAATVLPPTGSNCPAARETSGDVLHAARCLPLPEKVSCSQLGEWVYLS